MLQDSEKKRHFFDPLYTLGGKMKIPNPYCTTTRFTQSYPKYLLYTICNIDGVQMTSLI